jgi:hypothetical protein
VKEKFHSAGQPTIPFHSIVAPSTNQARAIEPAQYFLTEDEAERAAYQWSLENAVPDWMH